MVRLKSGVTDDLADASSVRPRATSTVHERAATSLELEHTIWKNCPNPPPNPSEAKTRHGLRQGAEGVSTDVEAKAPSCRGARGSVLKFNSVVTTDAHVKEMMCV